MTKKVRLGTLEMGTRFKLGLAQYEVCFDEADTKAMTGQDRKVIIRRLGLTPVVMTMTTAILVEVLP